MPNPPTTRLDRSMKKAPAACKRRGPFSYGAAALGAPDHSITAAFMITTIVARPGSSPRQRMLWGRSQR